MAVINHKLKADETLLAGFLLTVFCCFFFLSLFGYIRLPALWGLNCFSFEINISMFHIMSMEESGMRAVSIFKKQTTSFFLIIKFRFLPPREIINAEAVPLGKFTEQGHYSCIILLLKGHIILFLIQVLTAQR